MVSPLLVNRKVEQKDRKLDDWNEAHEPEGCCFSSFNGQCFPNLSLHSFRSKPLIVRSILFKAPKKRH